jgi:hypothetical protein
MIDQIDNGTGYITIGGLMFGKCLEFDVPVEESRSWQYKFGTGCIIRLILKPYGYRFDFSNYVYKPIWRNLCSDTTETFPTLSRREVLLKLEEGLKAGLPTIEMIFDCMIETQEKGLAELKSNLKTLKKIKI